MRILTPHHKSPSLYSFIFLTDFYFSLFLFFPFSVHDVISTQMDDADVLTISSMHALAHTKHHRLIIKKTGKGKNVGDFSAHRIQFHVFCCEIFSLFTQHVRYGGHVLFIRHKQLRLLHFCTLFST